LYGAVLDHVFSELTTRLIPVLESDLAPRQKILRYAETYFDAIASIPEVPRILQQEMMRAGRDGSPHIQRIGRTYTGPLAMRLRSVLMEGIRTGEFRKLDPQHFALTMVASVVFYFTCAPMLRAIFGYDPLAPERIAERRAAVLDFITHALFTRPDARERSSQRHSPSPAFRKRQARKTS
jgi:hypothetical protein